MKNLKQDNLITDAEQYESSGSSALKAGAFVSVPRRKLPDDPLEFSMPQPVPDQPAPSKKAVPTQKILSIPVIAAVLMLLATVFTYTIIQMRNYNAVQQAQQRSVLNAYQQSAWADRLHCEEPAAEPSIVPCFTEEKGTDGMRTAQLEWLYNLVLVNYMPHIYP